MSLCLWKESRKSLISDVITCFAAYVYAFKCPLSSTRAHQMRAGNLSKTAEPRLQSRAYSAQSLLLSALSRYVYVHS